MLQFFSISGTSQSHLSTVTSSFNRGLHFLQWLISVFFLSWHNHLWDSMPVQIQLLKWSMLRQKQHNACFSFFLWSFLLTIITCFRAKLLSLLGGGDTCMRCVENIERFPLKGGGITQLNKTHCVLNNGHPQNYTAHHFSPSEFSKAEGAMLSFFQLQLYCFSLSFSSFSPFILSPLFCDMCGLIITDSHSLFFLLLFPFSSGNAADSRTESVDALQQPQTTCQWGLAL